MATEATATEAPGNTTPGASWKARAYQFTLNEVDYYEDFKAQLIKVKSLDYLIACREKAPTTGHEHIHIYAHYKTPYKLPQRVLEFGAHIEKCRGTPKQNIAYIRKDGNVIDEIGEEPHQGIKSVRELREMNVDDVDPHLYRIKKEIDEDKREEEGFFNMLAEIESNNLKAPAVYYLTGKPGNGKTYKAYQIALENYPKEEIGRIAINNNFFKITNEKAKCFVVEEFRPSQLHASDFLQFIDKYGFNANVKGGFKYIRPEMILICSVMRPQDIYSYEMNEQFMRRISKIIEVEPYKPEYIDEVNEVM